MPVGSVGRTARRVSKAAREGGLRLPKRKSHYLVKRAQRLDAEIAKLEAELEAEVAQGQVKSAAAAFLCAGEERRDLHGERQTPRSEG